jgi:hypothetical protein
MGPLLGEPEGGCFAKGLKGYEGLALVTGSSLYGG